MKLVEKNRDLKVDIIGDYLIGKKIALGVSGGIAAIETPKIARHLRRYGADVKAYMTKEASKFIGKAALEWATEQDVVDELSGRSEHICEQDLVLVAPATTNTVNKIFSGIADNPVTTLVASALGAEVPVYLAPSMHESLYNNPFLQENLKRALDYGISVIPQRFSEGKAKIARLENIVAEISRELSEDPIKGKKILVTAGPTPVHVDSVRMITNIFKGRLGVEIAKELYHRGGDVQLLIGPTSLRVPSYLDVDNFRTYDEYKEKVLGLVDVDVGKEFDIGIFSAAVADYKPVTYIEGKIPSGGMLESIGLEPTEKVIELVRTKNPGLYMATFKFMLGKSEEELLDIASARCEVYDLVVANRGEDMTDDRQKAYIVGRDGLLAIPETKKEIAKALVDVIGNNY